MTELFGLYNDHDVSIEEVKSVYKHKRDALTKLEDKVNGAGRKTSIKMQIQRIDVNMDALCLFDVVNKYYDKSFKNIVAGKRECIDVHEALESARESTHKGVEAEFGKALTNITSDLNSVHIAMYELNRTECDKYALSFFHKVSIANDLIISYKTKVKDNNKRKQLLEKLSGSLKILLVQKGN